MTHEEFVADLSAARKSLVADLAKCRSPEAIITRMGIAPQSNEAETAELMFEVADEMVRNAILTTVAALK